MNEVMFYGGLIVTGVSLVAGGIYLWIFRLKRARLRKQLEEAYGEKE